MKDKTTSALLAIFLGGFGIHRFYLGQIGLGFLYLIFCWTFIPSIVSIIDFVIFLSMDFNYFNIKYNDEKSIYVYTNVLDELEKLHSLKQKGIISQIDFDKRKANILK